MIYIDISLFLHINLKLALPSSPAIHLQIHANIKAKIPPSPLSYFHFYLFLYEDYRVWVYVCTGWFSNLMNLIEDTLEPHEGVSKNNLDEIFHIDDEYINEEDFQIETRFKMSPYFDHTNINEYCDRNNETLNHT